MAEELFQISPRGTPANVSDRRCMYFQTRCEFLGSEWRFSDEANLIVSEFGESRSSDVLGMRHWFQVFWTNTSWLFAKMIKLKTIWDSTYFLLVHRTMSANRLSTNGYLGVTPPVGRSTERNPAAGYVSTIFLSPHIRRNSVVSVRTCTMMSPVSLVFSSGKSSFTFALLRNGRWSTTTTQTQSRWIGWINIKHSSFMSPMAMKVGTWISFLMTILSRGVNACILPTTTYTQHSSTLALRSGDRHR